MPSFGSLEFHFTITPFELNTLANELMVLSLVVTGSVPVHPSAHGGQKAGAHDIMVDIVALCPLEMQPIP